MTDKRPDGEPDTTPPDPEPERTPGLEPGGGVRPGDTPPAAGQVSGVSDRQPEAPKSTPVVAIVVTAVLVLAVAGFFVAYLINVLAD